LSHCIPTANGSVAATSRTGEKASYLSQPLPKPNTGKLIGTPVKKAAWALPSLALSERRVLSSDSRFPGPSTPCDRGLTPVSSDAITAVTTVVGAR
jgi:hypothetical protein